MLTSRGVITAGKETIRAGSFLMLPHPLSNLEIKSIIKMNLDLIVLIQQIIT